MSSTDELSDLMRTAAHGRAGGGDAQPNTQALISRARRRQRRRQRLVGVGAVAAMVLLAAAALPVVLHKDDDSVNVATGGSHGFEPGWTRLPDPPLSTRGSVSTAAVGQEVVVVGGAGPCLTPDCTFPDRGETYADGAAFTLGTRTWRSIAPAPRPFSNARSVVVDGAMYVLVTPCEPAPCLDQRAMLRYQPADDRWDVLPAPPQYGDYALVPAGRDIVAYPPENADPGLPDWRYDMAAGAWAKLPDDPLPRGYNRQIVEDGDALVLFANEHGSGPDGSNRVGAARLDLGTEVWSQLPPAPGSEAGFQPTSVAGVVIVDPDKPGSPVQAFDPASRAWRSLPAPPDGVSRQDMAGVLRDTTSVFTAADGWVLDVAAERWIRLPSSDDRVKFLRPPSVSTTITSFGRNLFHFSDNQIGPEPQPDARNVAWVWAPPGKAEATDPTPVPRHTVAPVPSTVPSTPVTTPATAPPGAPGAPQFISATADAAAGKITVRFDRPVVPGSTDTAPQPNNAPKSVLMAMSLIVFGDDPACTGPDGNAHEYLAGMGTDTITTDASSLAPGTTYIAIVQGFVKSAADGTPNSPVVMPGRDKAGFFDASCIPVQTSGTVPVIPTTTEPVGGPELVSATGDAASGRMTLKFSRPVVPGDGSDFDPMPGRPTPADSMPAMALVVHMSDSTCSSPNGNAHEYLAGMGTDTLTTDATSLVVGTTYVSIQPGFAKAADDGKPMRRVPCLAVKVTG